MRQLALAGATLATLALAATLSAAHADSYYGPIKVGNQCWVRGGHNSLGYWKTCDTGGTAQAKIVRTSGKKK